MLHSLFRFNSRRRRIVLCGCLSAVLLCLTAVLFQDPHRVPVLLTAKKPDPALSVPAELTERALRAELDSLNRETPLSMAAFLACLAARCEDRFDFLSPADIRGTEEYLKQGQSPEAVSGDPEGYRSRLVLMKALFSGLTGPYEIRVPRSEAPVFAGSDAAALSPAPQPQPSSEEEAVWVSRYGLRAFYPLASYETSDGQKKQAVLAPESGTVESVTGIEDGFWQLEFLSLSRSRRYLCRISQTRCPFLPERTSGTAAAAGELLALPEPDSSVSLSLLLIPHPDTAPNLRIPADTEEFLRFLRISPCKLKAGVHSGLPEPESPFRDPQIAQFMNQQTAAQLRLEPGGLGRH